MTWFVFGCLMLAGCCLAFKEERAKHRQLLLERAESDADDLIAEALFKTKASPQLWYLFHKANKKRIQKIRGSGLDKFRK